MLQLRKEKGELHILQLTLISPEMRQTHSNLRVKKPLRRNSITRKRCVDDAAVARNCLPNDIITGTRRQENRESRHIFRCSDARERDIFADRIGMVTRRFVHIRLERARRNARHKDIVLHQLSGQTAGQVNDRSL